MRPPYAVRYSVMRIDYYSRISQQSSPNGRRAKKESVAICRDLTPHVSHYTQGTHAARGDATPAFTDTVHSDNRTNRNPRG